VAVLKTSSTTDLVAVVGAAEAVGALWGLHLDLAGHLLGPGGWDLTTRRFRTQRSTPTPWRPGQPYVRFHNSNAHDRATGT
jgi:hypothetical protein